MTDVLAYKAPTLHLMCGKIASGKSTLAARLGETSDTVVIAEDVWLGALFSDQMATPRDFVRYSAKLREAMGPHVVNLLRAGLSVVLDFHANTIESRSWMRGLAEVSGADHRLHVLETSDEVCLARLRVRNEIGAHPFTVSEAQFHQISAYYEAPTPDEGFTILRHNMDD